MFRLGRPSLLPLSNLRFFDDCDAESGVPADDPEAAALCMNFIVKSLDETPLGVSGAMMAVLVAASSN
jgi:hypothetical protein